MNNKPVPENFKQVRNRATLGAIAIMEIVQDIFPDVTQSEGKYYQALYRLADYLHDRDHEFEIDLVQQLTHDN